MTANSKALTRLRPGKRLFKRAFPARQAWLSRLRGSLARVFTHEEKVLKRSVREGRFQRSLALITGIAGLFTGLEVAYEHYRGSYGQRIMYTPLLLSFALMFAGFWGALSRRAARTVLRYTSLLTMLDGVVGFFYHVRGIARKPGGWRLPLFNLIMGPPLCAPLLFSSVGFLGLLTSFLRREETLSSRVPEAARSRFRWPKWIPRAVRREEIVLEQDVSEGRFQRVMGVVTALSTLFSWIEAFYSHYKNNFSYRIQWSPILTGPLLIFAALGTLWSRTIARVLLPITSLLALVNGGIGFYYHVRGVVRRPGGLKKPLYNILYGPPIFAPLIFAASGFIGLLTSLLRRTKA